MEYTNSQVSALIDDLIHSERDRSIMKRRYIDGITYERLAEEFNLSVPRIKTIVYHGWNKVINYL